MYRSERTLFRSLLHMVKKFKQQEVPFTGVPGSKLICWGLDGTDAFRDAFSDQGKENSISFEGKSHIIYRHGY